MSRFSAVDPPSTKDATVYIIDVSPSMQQPLSTPPSPAPVGEPAGSSSRIDASSDPSPVVTTTRLSAAITAVQKMIASSMLHSKSHECSVILIGTLATSHHLANDGELGAGGSLRYITELGPMARPGGEIFKTLQRVGAEGN